MGVKKLTDYCNAHEMKARKLSEAEGVDPATSFRKSHEEELNKATGPLTGLVVKNTTNKEIFYNVYYEVDGKSGVDCSAIAPGEFDILPYYDSNLHFSIFESENHILTTINVGDVVTVSDSGIERALPADYSDNEKQTFAPHLETIHILDVWGEGRINISGFKTGFKTAYNFNKGIQLVSNGADKDHAIPNLLPTFSYDDPRIPLPGNCARYVTLMGAPIVKETADEILRVVDQYQGEVILYDPDSSAKQIFEDATRTVYNGQGQQMVDITSHTRLRYPFNEISMEPHYVYGWRNV